MSDFLNRFREAANKKTKALKTKMVKRALKLAQIHTPIDKGLLRQTIREVEINNKESLILWGSVHTLRATKYGAVGYEKFVAFGTKFQIAQLYHVHVANILAKEFEGKLKGSVTPSTGQITYPSKYY